MKKFNLTGSFEPTPEVEEFLAQEEKQLEMKEKTERKIFYAALVVNMLLIIFGLMGVL